MAFSGKISSNLALTPTVFLLKMTVSGDPPFSFKAGQFIIVPLPPEAGVGANGKALKGFYSIASAEQNAADIELLIEHREDGGPVSAWMSGRQSGDSVEVQGPLGHFGLAETDIKAQVFLGHRAGLAPLRSMLLSSLAQPGGREHCLFLGAQDPADLLMDAEWRALAKSEPRFHYEAVADPAEALLKSVPTRSGLRIYVAGFSKDVDPMVEKLKAAGFSAEDLKAEKFG